VVYGLRGCTVDSLGRIRTARCDERYVLRVMLRGSDRPLTKPLTQEEQEEDGEEEEEDDDVQTLLSDEMEGSISGTDRSRSRSPSHPSKSPSPQGLRYRCVTRGGSIPCCDGLYL
jgi:hypothetical protein